MSILHKMHFNAAPVLLAAWTGAGNVGILSIDFIRRKLESHLFGQIDLSRFIVPDSVLVNEGVVRFPETPQSVFYHHHDPDLVIFESNAQLAEKEDIETIRAILDLASELKTRRIYTASALPLPISHAEEPQVYYACSTLKLVQDMELYGLTAMPDGAIPGPNGLLVGYAGTRQIDAICLIAAIPAYAAGLTYPRAALAVTEALQKIESIDLDLSELEKNVEESDQTFAEVEGKIREFFSEENAGDEPQPEVESKNIPKYVMDRIERLFNEVKKDRSRAQELKNELDRWELYKLYEDRFLDLFSDT